MAIGQSKVEDLRKGLYHLQEFLSNTEVLWQSLP